MSAENAESLGAETERDEVRMAQSRDELMDTIRSLSEIEGSGDFRGEVAHALRLALTSADSLTGECQISTPFAPLRPVITKDGELRWCCSHPTQHCVAG